MPVVSPTAPVERHVTLHGVSWSLYQSMLSELAESHVRLTYDRGRLEIMSPLPIHEQVKKVAARLIETYAEETGVEAEGLGSTTFDREDLLKGLEPDECYYVQNAAAVIGRTSFDWEVDPPPDLAIEVDISPPDVARQPIYAALGVSEVWRYDGRAFTFLHRQEPKDVRETHFVASDRSAAFPDLPLVDLNRFVSIGLKEGQTAAVRAMRAWCQGQAK